MRGSSSPVVVVAIFVAVLTAFLPTSAQAQGPFRQDLPFAQEVANPCVAEPVFVEGRITAVTYVRPDASGGNHFTFRIMTKGKGFGVSSPFEAAKEYVYSSESILEINAPSSGTYEETGILNQIFVRKSEADTALEPLATGEDFMLKQTAHITIANGVATVTFSKGEPKCM